MAVRFLIGEFQSNTNMKRTNNSSHTNCDYCLDIYDIEIPDSNIHIAYHCPIISDKDDLKALKAEIIATVCNNNGINAAFKLSSSPTLFTLLCANPTSLQLNHLVNTDIDNIKELILVTQKYLLRIYNARKKYGKQKPSRSSNPRTEDPVPVRSNLLPPPGNDGNDPNH